jgi:serine/threonine-protein kinase
MKNAQASTPAITRVGRFYVTKELASGSIGTVYLARDPIIDREVAIKTFSPKLPPLEKKQREQQLINEARAAGRLSHSNIVTIYDASTENGITYIAMEYLQGQVLSRMLDKGHRFPVSDTAAVVMKLADALSYAHQNGVIHRDIKPANIFMVGDRQPKIVDFGIARAPNRIPEEMTFDDTAPYTLFHNNLLGTPAYMSPEQALGRPADERSDIYSLGAVMYEMLTGRKPFHAKTTDDLLHTIAHKAPPAPNELNPKIPVPLSETVMKAMNKKPEKRYQSADEMAEDIKNYINGERRAARIRRSERQSTSDMSSSEPSESTARLKPWIIAAIAGTAVVSALLLWLR